MTNLLISVLISGIAVTYTVELLDLVTFSIFSVGTINKVLSLPLSFGYIYCLQPHISKEYVASVPASTFIALFVNKYLHKPTVVNNFSRLTRG